jgi:hypothetical protein
LRTTPGLISSMMLVEPIFSIVHWQLTQGIGRKMVLTTGHISPSALE